ncbi:methylcrotonoyl-CoA carboxylase beta chain, mitochondrial-like isoform X2 [Varanus komodoensis]|uniref:methylcrotonoyl-CoA carboxylase beta chain, mitochondrial-like isoform X2 n=1 Tax=Varanus komodoensis TaxID=61221 RepID=UPI001CF7C966|nr:methylcrotonoyl-CoA carboxylase beta chain, mitochondrial-like isoform X2 [Varanus komodoensis]
MWNHITLILVSRYPRCFLSVSCFPLFQPSKKKCQEFGMGRQQILNLLTCEDRVKSVNLVPHKMIHSSSVSFKLKAKQHMRNFPVLDGSIPSLYRHAFEVNAKNSAVCIQRYSELLLKISKGGGKNAVLRHTERNKKLLVRERIKMLLDDEPFLELSPFAGLDMPYGDVPAAGCLTGIGKICGVWCVFVANDATVKGGTIYPISVKKQLRAQEIAIKNRLPSIYLVDSGGAFLPLQAELFPDQFHGGRIFYNEAVMSSLRIPQVAVVCGSCTAGGAYVPTMAEETIIVDKIGTMFLAGPPLVKAATGEDIHPDELGGANLHSKISGCVDHFASSEKEAYECVRNIISTLNYEIPLEETSEFDSPLYSSDELLGLAPQGYSYTLHIKLILSRMIDGSRFQEFKANYGTTLVTGFAYIEGQLVGVVANNGELTHDASLKGSHFVQLCSQRRIPVLFLLNTAPCAAEPTSLTEAEDHSKRLKAQASMMAAVACASVPKITLVIGGCYGNESYAMCGRSFDPNFLFLWPNTRIALVDSRHFPTVSFMRDNDSTAAEADLILLKEKLEEESSAFYSSARIWDDGVILPQNSRKVIAQCLRITKQQKYQIKSHQQSPLPVIRLC